MRVFNKGPGGSNGAEDFNDLLIVVPVYQHTGALWQTLRMLRMTGESILVVNDGDGPQLTNDLASEEVKCRQFDRNRGVGAALQEGLRVAREERYCGVLTVDADYAHDETAVEKVLSAATQNPARAVLSTRLGSGEDVYMPSAKIAANRFAAALFGSVTGWDLADVASGLRYLPTALCEEAWEEAGFGWIYESLLRMLKLGLVCQTVRIVARYPSVGPYATSRRELIDFLSYMDKISEGSSVAGELLSNVGQGNSEGVIEANIGGRTWAFSYVGSSDAFVIQER